MFRIKKITYPIVIVAALALLGSGFVSGYSVGKSFPEVIEVEGVTNIAGPSDVDFSTFWESWQLINSDYLKSGEVSPKDKMYGAISGLVNSLGDPYSEFFSPEDSQKFQEDIQGNFSGIGAEIGLRKDQLTIIAPLKNSPAMRAGLKAGDQILLVDSTSTQDLTLDQAVRIIRGQEGTQVKLTILRTDWDESREFTITRARIEAPTLDFEMRGDIAYIQLYSFNANAGRLFYDAIVKASNANARGVVLDLRNNPGGYLEVAVDLAGWFLPRGQVVVREANKNGTTDEFKARGNASLANIPTVVLINQGSASASEILAGALRDQRGIKLIGEKSFGKGTVQQLKDLRDGSSIKITIAHWVLPNGQILENEGLKPDIEVKLTEEDFEKDRDPQLDKAFEVIRTQI